MKDPQDKRRYKRFLLPVTHYEGADDRQIRGVSDVWDVSRSGFRIFSSSRIKKGTVLNCKINIPNVLDIICQGEVQWSQPANRGHWEGLRFLTIDPTDKMDLLNYAYDSWLEAEKINNILRNS